MKKTIRACTEHDLDILQKIGRETYNDTFGKMNTAETMEKYLAEAFNKDKLLSELKNTGSKFFLLHADDALTGYLKINEAPAQTDINGPEGLEIERIYIRKRFKGKGYGKELLSFALQKASELHKSYAWLGVWERNENALAFYEHLGFEKAGKHAFKMGYEIQSDYIMEKTLHGGMTSGSR